MGPWSRAALRIMGNLREIHAPGALLGRRAPNRAQSIKVTYQSTYSDKGHLPHSPPIFGELHPIALHYQGSSFLILPAPHPTEESISDMSEA